MVPLSRIRTTAQEQKETVLTASLVTYIAAYLVLSLGGIGFQAQPAASYYYYDDPIVFTEESPNGTTVTSSDVNLSINVTDDVDGDPLDVDFRLDGTVNGTDTGVASRTFAWHIANGVQDGKRIWNATACDPDGNCGTSANYSFLVDAGPGRYDTGAPSVTCDDCDTPDPIKSGNSIEFDPEVSDPSGIQSVSICRDGSCSDTYCSGDPCTYETTPNTYSVNDYWIRAEDNDGNVIIKGPPQFQYNFTTKKWAGQSCELDEQCLVGACNQNECTPGGIPRPEIIIG